MTRYVIGERIFIWHVFMNYENVSTLVCIDVSVGALKMLDVKTTDVKLTDQFAGHEIAGHEIEGPMCRA